MLKTRVITALTIFPVVMAALFLAPSWVWATFTMIVMAAATWEWSRFCAFSASQRVAFYAASALLAALILVAYLFGALAPSRENFLILGLLFPAAIFWCAAVPFWLAQLWRTPSRLVAALTGLMVIFPTWLALLLLRDVNPWLLFSFAVIVWVADIAAYFVGKAFGRRKLAPEISPGKTVEGALGGIAGVVIYYFVWQQALKHSTVHSDGWVGLMQSQGTTLLLVFVLLACMSVVGDLFESWMKRGAGLKDSSNLLPGHGGILDRIDALTSALPLAALYMVFIGRTP